jgi:hypothetical protein
LLVARQELTAAATAQASRLRALLLTGNDHDRCAARKALSKTALAALAGRELPAHTSREHAVRQAEIRRLALARARPGASSKTTAASCWPSPTTSPPA